MEEELRLLIVADDPLARAALAMLLDEMLPCHVVGQLDSSAFTADPAAELDETRADVVLWDLGWETAVADPPDFSEVTVPVVVLLADSLQAGDAWAAGARALLTRDMNAEKMTAAVQAAAQGLTVLDDQLADALLPIPALAQDDVTETLTPRETEVLHLLAEGLTNKAIAQTLAISDHTVKFHVNAILGKLGAQSRTEAVVRATRLGLIAL